MATIQDIAQEIFDELGEPSDLTVSYIGGYLNSNIGYLNNLLLTSFTVNNITGLISPEISEDEKTIYKKIYIIYYYGRVISTNMGASAFNQVIEVSSDGSTVRRAARTNVAASYLQLKKQETDELKQLINGYKERVAGENTFWVSGDDFLTPFQNPSIPYVRVGDRGYS